MSDWGYGKNEGPEKWGDSYEFANGLKQSPINICTDSAVFKPELKAKPIDINVDVAKCVQQTLVFTGHNFKVDTSSEPITTTNGPVMNRGPFKLVQYHFHWGKDEKSHGSEHQIDGKVWPSELHLVHFDSNKYSSFGEAADKPDGLMVLGVMIEIGAENKELAKLISPLGSVRSFKSMDLSEDKICIDLRGLLPKDTSRYYTYSGSLTTPPCYESVTWVVFDEPISMSEDQLVQFRWLHMGDNCGTSENYRPVCPLNGRTVYKSFQ